MESGTIIDNELTVWFGSDAPVFSVTDLHKNGGYFVAAANVKENKVTVAFSAAGRDSVQGKIAVAATAAASKWITAIKLSDPDGDGVRTMVLTLNADYRGPLTSTITLEGTNEHDNVGVHTFLFTVCDRLGANGCAPIFKSLCDKGMCQTKKGVLPLAINAVPLANQVFDEGYPGIGKTVSVVALGIGESFSSKYWRLRRRAHLHQRHV
jgi:hypothetical protein